MLQEGARVDVQPQRAIPDSRFTPKRVPLKKTLSLVTSSVVMRTSSENKHKLSLGNLMPRIEEGENDYFKPIADAEHETEASFFGGKRSREGTLDSVSSNRSVRKNTIIGESPSNGSRYRDSRERRRSEVNKAVSEAKEMTDGATIAALNLDEVIQMDAKKEKELYDHYNSNSFYSLHMLLRYMSEQLTDSYQPSSRRRRNVNTVESEEAVENTNKTFSAQRESNTRSKSFLRQVSK